MKNASLFLVLLVAAALVGCGKSDPDTNSSTTTTGSSTTSTTPNTAGVATASTTGTTATSGTTGATSTTTGSTTPSTPAPTPSTTAPTKGSTGETGSMSVAPPSKSTATTTAPPATSSKPPTASPMGTTPGGAMSSEQKAQIEKMKAAIKKAGQQAEKATPIKLDNVDGTYKVDQTKLPPQAQKAPNLAQQLASLPAWTVTGTDVVVQAGSNPQVTGFTTKVDGATGLVLNVNSPQKDAPKKIFIPIPFSADGKSFVFRGLTYTKQK